MKKRILARPCRQICERKANLRILFVKKALVTVIAIALALWRSGGLAGAQQNPNNGPTNGQHPTRLLAKYARGTTPQAAARTLQQHGMKIHKHVPLVPGLVVLDSDPAQGVPPKNETAQKELNARMKALRDSAFFEYVEPDYVVKGSLVPSDSAFNDGTLWGLSSIDAERAWDITTGSTNVIVAVIDTGVRYTHQELAAQMWRNPGEIPDNGIDDDGDGYVDNVYGINAITGSGNPVDDHFHGTHVAGTIGAAANDGGPQVGVAWQVQLMACKFLNEQGYGNTSDAIECINFAVSKGARVLNNSWGAYDYSQALFDAIAATRNAGVLFVAAAGNGGADLVGDDNDQIPTYPASYELDNIVSVAALDNNDALAWFSNYGRTSVHIGAPGVHIYSCGAASDDDYRYLDGTSMATPHVSGVAALILARYPEITVAGLKQRLLNTTVPLPALSGRCTSGGRVNAYNALTATPDGVLEILVSTSSAPPLAAGSSVSLYVAVSDLTPVNDATVTGQIVDGSALTFANDGTPPDSVSGDHVYSATLEVPATGNNFAVQLEVSAPGKQTRTATATFDIRVQPLVPLVTPGFVFAIAEQDDGKIIIGGQFCVVNGVARSNIARLNADGSLDQTWDPGANRTVRQVVLSGADVFVLGEFDTIGRQNRNGLAKLNTTGDGAADALWNPSHPGNLHALAVSGTNLFVGGLSYLAKLSTTDTGDGDSPWGPQPDANINALVVRGTDLYLAGNFKRLESFGRSRLAKVDTLGAGVVDPDWDPDATGGNLGYIPTLYATESHLYVAGSFNQVGGVNRKNIARLILGGSGEADQWDPSADGGMVYALAVSGEDVYAGGSFSQIGGEPRSCLAKLSAADGAADPSWKVDTGGGFVSALATSRNSIFAGGNFATINGQACLSLAKLDTVTGARDDSFRAEVGCVRSAFFSLQFSSGEGLMLYGMAGDTYLIEYTENLHSPIIWLPLTTVTLSGDRSIIPGTRQTTKPQRFYRALLVP
jgi:subtilisin family serine protease